MVLCRMNADLKSRLKIFLTFLSGEFYNEFSMNFQMNLLKCAIVLCKTVRQQLRKQTKLNPAKAERSFEIIL